MAIAQYQRTSVIGREPDFPSYAEVAVDGEIVTVSYWPSLLTQTNPLFVMNGQDVIAYVEAEALHLKGHYADARAHLGSRATGTDTRSYDENGNVTSGTDTRNWAKRWIDEHPDLSTEQTWEVDPLLG